jgi:hypothetical protein
MRNLGMNAGVMGYVQNPGFPNVLTGKVGAHGLTLIEVLQMAPTITALLAVGGALIRAPAFTIELKNLTRLDLAKNKLTAPPDYISQLQKLVHIDLSDNYLEIVPMPRPLGQMITVPERPYVDMLRLPNLEYLGLKNNKLTNFPWHYVSPKCKIEMNKNYIDTSHLAPFEPQPFITPKRGTSCSTPRLSTLTCLG